MAAGFGLIIQQLPRRQDRVLAVGHLVGVRAGDKWFSPGDVAKMFESLRLPRPGNISQELVRLRDRELVMRRSTGGSWSLTPSGEEAVLALVGEVDADAVAAELAAAGTARLDGIEHPLIPPELAPVRFQPAVRRLLEISPFDRNVFCMTRYPDADADDPVTGAIAAAKETLAEHGLAMHLAGDRSADDELFGNVAAHIWGCKYGLAFLETLDPVGESASDKQLNDNVLIEIGAMLVSGRRCGLLKDHSAPRPPTDFIAQIYRELDLSHRVKVKDAVRRWVLDDLGLSA